MATRPRSFKLKAKEVTIMAHHHSFNHQVWRNAVLAVALGACLIFGVIVLTGGDWLPGGIIVVASTVGLAREVPIIRRLCGGEVPAWPEKTTLK
jgi:hypothetical protein